MRRQLIIILVIITVICISAFHQNLIYANDNTKTETIHKEITKLKESYELRNQIKDEQELEEILKTDIIEFQIWIENAKDIDITMKLNGGDCYFDKTKEVLTFYENIQNPMLRGLNADDKITISITFPKDYNLVEIDEFNLIKSKIKDTDITGFQLLGTYKLEPVKGSLLSNNIPWSLLIGLLSLLLLIVLLVLSLKNQKQILEETQTQSELMNKLIQNLNNYFNNNQPGIFLSDINDKIRNIQNLQNNINQKVENINQSNNPARSQDTQEIKASEPKISFLEYFNQLIRNRSRVSDDVLKVNYKLRNLDFENGQFRISQFLTNFWLYKDEIGDYYVIPSYSLLKPDFYKYFYEIRDYQNRINIKANVIVSIEKFTRLITRDNQVFDVVEKGIMLCSE